MGDKGGFPLVSIFDMHIVVPPHCISNLVNTSTPWSLSTRLEMRGRG